MKHTCLQCRKRFEGRRDAKFCGSTCRSRHHRRLQCLDKRFDRAFESVGDIAGRAWRRDGVDNSHAVILQQLHQMIDAKLQHLEKNG